MRPGRFPSVLSLIFGLFVVWGAPAFGDRKDILDDVLSNEDNEPVIFAENTNRVLSPEEQKKIAHQKDYLAQSMRKMLLGCTSYKRGLAQTGKYDPLQDWPVLRGLCFPSGEITLESKKSAAERVTFFYCKDTLVSEYCNSFGVFKDYCMGELIQACFAGYSGKPVPVMP